MGWGPGSLTLPPSQSGSSGRRKAKKKWRKDSPWVKPSRKRRKREPPRAKEPRGEEAPQLLGLLLQPLSQPPESVHKHTLTHVLTHVPTCPGTYELVLSLSLSLCQE